MNPRDFSEWRDTLRQSIGTAKNLGASEETLETATYHVGNFLANRVDPQNPEERLLRELWTVSSEDEQRTLARVITKLMAEEDYPTS